MDTKPLDLLAVWSADAAMKEQIRIAQRKAASRRWYVKNRKRIAEINKKKYAEHRLELIEKSKSWYRKNRKKILAKTRMKRLEYYYKNRKAILEYNHLHYEYRRAQKKLYYQKNRKYILAREKERYALHKETINAKRRAKYRKKKKTLATHQS